jgi:hypothetical protein
MYPANLRLWRQSGSGVEGNRLFCCWDEHPVWMFIFATPQSSDFSGEIAQFGPGKPQR